MSARQATARRLGRVTVALAMTLAVPLPALAQTAPVTPAHDASAQKEGREHFSRGVALYREGNFGGARAEFLRAYDIAPSYRILFNLGATAFELQDYAGAFAAFTRYLAEGGDGVPASRRAEVTKSLSELEQRVGRLVVTTNVPAAEIAVDGVRVGTTPLAAPLVVSVGRRTLTATVPGRVPISQTIDVASGDHTDVALDLVVPEVAAAPVVAIAAPPPLAPAIEPPVAVTPPRTESPAPPSRTPFWIGVAATGAFTASSAVFGALAIDANNTLNARLNQFPGSASSLSSARSDVHTYALATDLLGGAAIAAAGVTVYLGLSRRAPSASASIALGPANARLRLLF